MTLPGADSHTFPPTSAAREMAEERVCLECGRTPEEVLWNAAEGRLIHARLAASLADGTRRVCGGEVVWKGREWQACLRPGMVVVAHSTAPILTTHRVRLGRRANARGGSWTATALCGTAPYGNGLWAPTMPGKAVNDICADCETRFAKMNERDLR